MHNKLQAFPKLLEFRIVGSAGALDETRVVRGGAGSSSVDDMEPEADERRFQREII
jgi:hypothetical protein